MTYKFTIGLLALTCAAQSTEPPALRKFSFGGRIRILANGLFDNATTTYEPTTPAVRREDTTKNLSSRGALAPSVEYAFSRRWSVSADLFYQRARYEQATTIGTGTRSGDAAPYTYQYTTTSTERTRATFWDIPVLVQRRGFGENAFLSKVYAGVGGTARFVRSVKSGTETILPDDDVTTTYSEAATTPRTKQTFGATAAVGFRFVDDYRIRFAPEFRYTRWFGAPFDSNSTRTARGQMEVVLGITF
ncbi:MAG: outer membrane beta-barrel protein [Bryobacteraceae bacterium]|nr:outer membrane beta-barrel protein [Bryobacteraceae bacterium]